MIVSGPKRATLHNVAKKAGVAVSTVSSILNNRPDSWSSQKTRERVLAAAKALDYRPNRMARALRTSRFHAATLVVPDLTNPLFALLARYIQRALEQAGNDLLIEDTEWNPAREEKILADMDSHNTDGFIIVMSVDPAVYAPRLKELSQNFPLVLIAPPLPRSPFDTLQADWKVSLGKVIDHLTKLGHQSLGFVDSLANRSDGLERVALFREELAKLGLRLHDHNWVRCRHEVSEVRVATGRWASETSAANRATAFVCTNDLTAIGSIRGFLDAGLSVPEDISVVGFDDIPMASFLPRPLTTIAQPVPQIAEAACQTLLDRIHGKLQGPGTHQIFPTSLVIRETTAAPRP
jgi:LacI family transcriptional regulator